MALPSTLLILGTDAAGKNHLARLIARRWQELNEPLIIREGWLAAQPAEPEQEEDKGAFSLLKEQLFLALYPFCKPVFLPLLHYLIRRDIKNFQPQSQSQLVVSHTGLRLLAFHLGHLYKSPDEIRLPASLEKTLSTLKDQCQTTTVVLDIDHQVRQQRVQARRANGGSDPFDHYMARDEERSERIEDILVWLGRQFLQAQVIENNDLSEAELLKQLADICQEPRLALSQGEP